MARRQDAHALESLARRVRDGDSFGQAVSESPLGGPGHGHRRLAGGHEGNATGPPAEPDPGGFDRAWADPQTGLDETRRISGEQGFLEDGLRRAAQPRAAPAPAQFCCRLFGSSRLSRERVSKF